MNVKVLLTGLGSPSVDPAHGRGVVHAGTRRLARVGPPWTVDEEPSALTVPVQVAPEPAWINVSP